ncbi:unnamed protein product [Victoria cruziana]
MSCSSSRKGLSKIACNRLQKELMEWQGSPPPGFKHKVSDNLQRWVVDVIGAPGTIYASERYQLQVDFPEHYPMEAPQVIFLHPAPMHPHIYSNGHICLGNPGVGGLVFVLIFPSIFLLVTGICFGSRSISFSSSFPFYVIVFS